MKKPIIYEPLKNAKRIKVYIPYQLFAIRNNFKKLDSTYWHPQQKLWSILNTKENLVLVKEVFNQDFEMQPYKASEPVKKRILNEKSDAALFALETTLLLKKVW